MTPPEEDALAAGRARELARHILRYVLRHPGAKDTAGGIREWWFAEQQMPEQEEMQRALDALVGRGWIVRSGSTEPVYGLAAGGAQAVRDFLEDEAP